MNNAPENDFRNLAQQRILSPRPKQYKILRTVLPATATFAAVVGLIFLGWNAYQENSNGPVDISKIPVVKADNKPYKTQPENQNEEVAGSDKKVYDAISPGKAENEGSDNGIKVMTQEEPVDRNIKIQDQKTNAVQEVKEAPPVQGSVEESDDEVVKPAEAVVAAAPKSPPAAPVNNNVAAPVLNNAPAPVDIAKPAAVAAVNSAAVKLAEMKKPVEEKPAPVRQEKKPARKDKSEQANAKAMAKSIKVQLGAFKSSEEAHKEWERISRKFHKYLTDLKPIITRADVKNKGIFYRLQAGPVKSESAAHLLCKKLSEAKQGCFIANPK